MRCLFIKFSGKHSRNLACVVCVRRPVVNDKFCGKKTVSTLEKGGDLIAKTALVYSTCERVNPY